ncbi:MAG: tRNA (adenosine(37)-N6)-threonylcarbamoyltransferase complex dimerization subunit type 1 TsaB [Oscillospiraceae bacterium]|nr:tRNA (adenosine(37)-N6)-threonylcarbamoyltransferase complex dimerization subunit type 1 TsaB [Oscillospiraceae bacterium]
MAVRLGLDASQMVASCALSTEAGVIAAYAMDKPIENFTVLIQKILADAGKTLDDLDEIVVCIGPGSQTGIRAAVVTANALAMALNIPVSAILSIDAAAIAPSDQEIFDVGVSAGRSRWYTARYRWTDGKLERVTEPVVADELPDGVYPAFPTDIAEADGGKSCACAILKVIESQPHLAEQYMSDEIALYREEEVRPPDGEIRISY